MCLKMNDDCWLNILRYVPLKEQLALAQVNESLHGNVLRHWKTLKTANLEQAEVEEFQQNEALMLEFLKCASGSLQELQLQRGNIQLLQAFSNHNYTFPKIKTLEYTSDYDQEHADKETLLLVELFPNLINLTLCSNTCGRFLWLWQHLEELHLIWCEYLDTQTFPQIFSSLKLKKLTLLYYGYNVNLGNGALPASQCITLEELRIDDHHLLGQFLPNLLQLPHLRRLAFYTRDYYEHLLDTVAKQQPLKVQSLVFNDAFWNSDHVTNAIVQMSHLRSLSLQEDDIEIHLLQAICRDLPMLEELHLMKMRALPTSSQLWAMVDSCQSLRVLNLSNSKLDDEFMEPSNAYLKQVLNKRRTPLRLQIFNTGWECNPQGILDALKHENLEIDFHPVDPKIWSSRFIEIGFEPK